MLFVQASAESCHLTVDALHVGLPGYCLPVCLQMLRGMQKKGIQPEELAAKGAATSQRQESLLLLLNLLNAGGSLVLPCALVLTNQVIK